jgi:hypothetical protein
MRSPADMHGGHSEKALLTLLDLLGEKIIGANLALLWQRSVKNMQGHLMKTCGAMHGTCSSQHRSMNCDAQVLAEIQESYW